MIVNIIVDGVEGTGKTTALSGLERLLEEDGRFSVYHHKFIRPRDDEEFKEHLQRFRDILCSKGDKHHTVNLIDRSPCTSEPVYHPLWRDGNVPRVGVEETLNILDSSDCRVYVFTNPPFTGIKKRSYRDATMISNLNRMRREIKVGFISLAWTLKFRRAKKVEHVTTKVESIDAKYKMYAYVVYGCNLKPISSLQEETFKATWRYEIEGIRQPSCTKCSVDTDE